MLGDAVNYLPDLLQPTAYRYVDVCGGPSPLSFAVPPVLPQWNSSPVIWTTTINSTYNTLTHSLTHSPTHSLTHSLAHSPAHTDSDSDSDTRTLIQRFASTVALSLPLITLILTLTLTLILPSNCNYTARPAIVVARRACVRGS